MDVFRNSPSGVDAISFSCGALSLVEEIPLLEEELGIDPVEIRLKNALHPGGTNANRFLGGCPKMPF